jgi:hypothetical protein
MQDEREPFNREHLMVIIVLNAVAYFIVYLILKLIP